MQKTIKKIDRIDEIAKHYGFKKMNVPSSQFDEDIFLNPLQKKPILQEYKDFYSKKRKPVSLIYNNKQILFNKKTKTNNSFKNFDFDILGISDSIAEATIIHIAIVSLKEEGYKRPFVNINSLGDKDSLINFKNSLFEFYKSRAEKLHPKCRRFYKKDVFKLFLCNHRECKNLRKKAPRPIYFLSDKSRKHLKNTLEYLESMNIPYNIDDLLTSSNNHFSKIVFEIKHKSGNSGEKEILLGRGGRYDKLARNTVRRKIMPAVGVSLEFPKKKKRIIARHRRKSPEFYFIQFGPDAKQKSLTVIEQLRKSKLKIKQSLHINKFEEQLDEARKLGTQYTLILGQKEVANNTIIVKDLKSATLKSVKMNQILSYLKQLK